MAQEIQKSSTTAVENYLSAYSRLKVDSLLIIEDVNPEISLDGRKPLLLVHGWSFDGNPSPPGGYYWNNFLNYLKNDPELSANFKPYLVMYWSNDVPVKEIAAEFRNQLEKIGLHEQKLTIIGHSMGGLVSRSFMNEQYYTTGNSMGEKCGNSVDLLITLSTPHHGSPMANGPARNAKVPFFLQLTMNTVDGLVFSETAYDEVNRTDLHWDNYDELLDYQNYSDEKNNWLISLNENTIYDERTICYSGAVKGQFLIPDAGNLDEVYTLGAYFMEQGFGFSNDGIVPVQSSQFEGHTMQALRHFETYNHTDIIVGKNDENELFEALQIDLLGVSPLKLIWPGTAINYIKHSQYRDIEWKAPSTINKLNIYFSSDSGNTYSLIADKINAADEKFSWFFPDINSSECFIKIEDAESPNTTSVSANPFTIFHNQITITKPAKNNYFVRYKDNIIQWTQEGIGEKVNLNYIDSENNIEKVIAENVSTNSGNNSFVWSADESLPPTGQAVIQIQLQDLYPKYGDDEIYKFTSDPFKVFGDPVFTILTPETSPVDYFGIAGEEVLIGSIFFIKWKAEGEIKYVEFYLCDKDKNTITSLGVDSNAPALVSSRISRINVPEIFGNEFYILARAGEAINSIQLEKYSERTFRINRKPQIILPVAEDSMLSIRPCFEVASMDNADRYTFFLQDTLASDEHHSWEYQSASPQHCIPPTINNELQPGMAYLLTVVAHFDTIVSFANQIKFSAERTAPWAFNIVQPVNGDSTLEDSIQIVWTRSVAANNYLITAKQNGIPFLESDLLEPEDTSFTLEFYDIKQTSNIEIEVKAFNVFGETSVKTELVKEVISDGILMQNSAPNYRLRNYPNPVSDATVFEFMLPGETKTYRVSLILRTLSGQKIQTIIEGELTGGLQQVRWHKNENGHQLKPGNYICQLRINEQTTSRIFQIH